MESGCRRRSRGCSIAPGKSNLFPKPSHTQALLCGRNVVPDGNRLANKNTNSMISYPNYKFIFPIKAFGMYMQRYGDESLR